MKLKAVSIVCGLLLLLAGALQVSAAPITTLFNTGVDDNGQVLPAVPDPHYTITRIDYAGCYVCGGVPYDPQNPPTVLSNYLTPQPPMAANILQSTHPAWIPNGSTSKWVSYDGFFGSSMFFTGLYTYQTTFDLTGLDPNSVQISGVWGTDDPGWMYLNLADANVPDINNLVVFGGGFSSLTPFTISGTNGLFRPGLNTLTFVVWDAGNAVTGLRMDIQSAMADPLQCLQPPAGMISWWTGDGNARDSVDGNDGTLINGAGFAPGKIGPAFSLDGVNGYVDVGNAPNLHVSSGDFTVDAWVYFNALAHEPGATNAPPGDMSIVDKMLVSGDVNVDGWRLLKQDDNRFWFCLGGGDRNRCFDPDFTVFSSTVAEAGKWYHVAAVKDASGISIYVNGVREDSRSPLPAFLDTNSTNLLIGANAVEIARLNGLIDEVEIFNRALTAEEIESIYFAGGTGKCKPIQVPVDIRPGGCPNPLSTRELGVLPVAIAGTATLDVTQIDPASVRLEGVAPLRFSLADVATPYEPYTGKVNALDCAAAGPDGIVDLTLSFDAPAIIAALGPVVDGQVRVLTLTGNLLPAFGGRPIVGEDVIVIQVPRGQPR